MPRSKYRSLYLATAPGWAPSQEKNSIRGREGDSDWFWEEADVCEGESESLTEGGEGNGAETGQGAAGVSENGA